MINPQLSTLKDGADDDDDDGSVKEHGERVIMKCVE